MLRSCANRSARCPGERTRTGEHGGEGPESERSDEARADEGVHVRSAVGHCGGALGDDAAAGAREGDNGDGGPDGRVADRGDEGGVRDVVHPWGRVEVGGLRRGGA